MVRIREWIYSCFPRFAAFVGVTRARTEFYDAMASMAVKASERLAKAEHELQIKQMECEQWRVRCETLNARVAAWEQVSSDAFDALRAARAGDITYTDELDRAEADNLALLKDLKQRLDDCDLEQAWRNALADFDFTLREHLGDLGSGPSSGGTENVQVLDADATALTAKAMTRWPSDDSGISTSTSSSSTRSSLADSTLVAIDPQPDSQMPRGRRHAMPLVPSRTFKPTVID
ncbi:hypothetical protein C7R54_01185 [Achromobacter aloeverae]|uniref:Uncharacterized protein n=2 Tax=Achromobacter aloeverae TaxID=1750518 RepID=A0A4Q1HP13_9BURK|nr:hypothetical protein C7R54_01185 [Achromobacter aloeverae]